MKLPSLAFIALLAAATAKSDEDEYFYPRRQTRRRINRVRIQNRDVEEVGSMPTPAPVKAETDEPTESPTDSCEDHDGTHAVNYVGESRCVDSVGSTFASGELKETSDNFKDCADACEKLGLSDFAGIEYYCDDGKCSCLLNGSEVTKSADAVNAAFEKYVPGTGVGYPVKKHQVKAKLQALGNDDVLCGAAVPPKDLIFVKEA